MMNLDSDILTNVFRMLTERISNLEDNSERQQKILEGIEKRSIESCFHHYGEMSGSLFNLPFEIEYHHGWKDKPEVWAPGYHRAMIVQLEGHDEIGDEQISSFPKDDDDIDIIRYFNNRLEDSLDVWLRIDKDRSPHWFISKAWELCGRLPTSKIKCFPVEKGSICYDVFDILLEFWDSREIFHLEHSPHFNPPNSKSGFIKKFVEDRLKSRWEHEELVSILEYNELTSFYCQGALPK